MQDSSPALMDESRRALSPDGSHPGPAAGLGLRGWAVVLVLLATLPLLFMAVLSARDAEKEAIRRAHAQLMDAASLAADTQLRIMESARDLLIVMTHSPQLTEPGWPRCAQYFAQLRDRFPDYSNLGVAAADGRVVCSVRQGAGVVNIGDREFFIEALRHGGFTVSPYVIGRLSGLPIITFGLPVKAGADDVVGVAFASYPVAVMGRNFDQLALSGDTEVMLLDGRGTILAGRTGKPLGVGEQPRSPTLVQALAGRRTGVVEGLDSIGQLRIYAIAPVRKPRLQDGPQAGDPVFFTVVSMSHETVLAPAHRTLRERILAVLLGMLAGVAIAWWLGSRAVVEPALRIARATRRIGQGEPVGALRMAPFAARELVTIARDVEDMARVLRGRQQDLERQVEERTAELSRQRARFQTLADQAPQIVWNTDADGHVVYVNRAWTDLVGGNAEQWMGDRWTQVIHPDDLEPTLARWRQARAARATFEDTRRFRSHDGQWHTMQCRAAPVLRADGTVDFWVGVDADVTRMERIQQALKRSNEELEAFSYSISHDLRTPLSAINGFAQLLGRQVPGDAGERVRHYAARIDAGVRQMAELIDDLLLLARISRAPIEFTQVDLGDIARHWLRAMAQTGRARPVKWRVDDGLLVRGDERLLRMLIENLLSNAWKFSTREAGVDIHVGCSQRQDDWIVIFVRDSGIGFDMAYADKLFGAFQQLQPARESAGSGVGLATVRRIVQRHGGTVWAEGVPGQGACFYLRLPAVTHGVAAPPATAGDSSVNDHPQELAQ